MRDTVAVLSAGQVGVAWAIAFARAGATVRVWDANPADGGTSPVELATAALRDLAAANLLDGEDVTEMVGRLQPIADLPSCLEGVSYVQECGTDELGAKRALWLELDRLTPPSVILASASSALLPSSFTSNLPFRHRCLAVHALQPAYLVPAVELVPAPWTAETVMLRAEDLLRGAGLRPILLRQEVPGFVMDRLQAVLFEEAAKLVAAEVCDPEAIEIGVRDGLALRWAVAGPFETADLDAPGGIREGIKRQRTTLGALRSSPLPRPDWDGPVLDEIEWSRRLRLLASDLEARQHWRQRFLAALARHRCEAARELGE